MAAPYIYVVMGGQLKTLDPPPHSPPIKDDFSDPNAVEFAGAYQTYDEAYRVWRGRAQATVDNALMRFFIVPLNTEDLPPVSDVGSVPGTLHSKLRAFSERLRAGFV